MSNTSVKISLAIADGAAQKALSSFTNNAKAADTALGKLEDKGKSVFGVLGVEINSASDAFSVFKGSLAAELVADGLRLMGDAAKAAFNVFIVDGVKAAEEAQVALNNLNQSLGRTGIYSEDTSKEIAKFAKELQNSSIYTEEQALNAASLIQDLASLDKDGLQRATKAAADLAAVLGIDLESAASLVAKAANGNVTALNKYGLSIQKGTTDSQTFANALQTIEDRFGGSAKGKMESYTGAITALGNSFGEVQEETGNLIIQNPVIIAAINATTGIFNNLAESIDGNKSSLQTLIGEGFLEFIRGSQTFIAGLDIIVRGVKGFTAAMATAVYSVLALAEGYMSFSLFEDRTTETFDNLMKKATEFSEVVRKSGEEQTGLQTLGQGLYEIEAASKAAFDAMKGGAEKASPSIVNAGKEVKGLSDVQKEALESAEKLSKKIIESAENSEAKYKSVKERASESLDGQLEAIRANAEASGGLTQEQLDAQALAYADYHTKIRTAREIQAAEEQSALEIAYANQKISFEKYQLGLKSVEENYKSDKAKSNYDELVAHKKLQDEKNKMNERYAQTAGQIAGNLAGLMNQKNRQLFEVGKAASIAQATINTYEGATKAFAQGGILGPALAATIVASGLAQVASIASTDYSYAKGGVVGDAFVGATTGGDNVTANLRTGEMVLNASQQKRLFEIANGAGASANSEGLAAALLAIADRPVVVQIDGREVFRSISSDLKSGRTF